MVVTSACGMEGREGRWKWRKKDKGKKGGKRDGGRKKEKEKVKDGREGGWGKGGRKMNSGCQDWESPGRHEHCLVDKLSFAKWNEFQRWMDVTVAQNMSILNTTDYCCCLVILSCPTLLWPHGLQLTRFHCPWDFSGKDTGVGCHFLLQGIFPTQRLNPCLLYWQVDSLPVSYQGNPNIGKNSNKNKWW